MPSQASVTSETRSYLSKTQPFADFRYWHELFDPMDLVVGTAAEFDPDDTVLGTYTQAENRLNHRLSRRWMLTGTNAAIGDVALSTGGGINISGNSTTTDNTSIVSPLVYDPSGTPVQGSGWGATPWVPARRPWMSVMAGPVTALATFYAHVALKMTANVDLTTDNIQLGFIFNGATDATRWIPYQSVGGTDYALTPRFSYTPTVGLPDLLEVRLDVNRMPHWYINGELYATVQNGGAQFATTSTAGTWASWAPVFGVKNLSSTKTTMQIAGVRMRRSRYATAG